MSRPLPSPCSRFHALVSSIQYLDFAVMVARAALSRYTRSGRAPFRRDYPIKTHPLRCENSHSFETMNKQEYLVEQTRSAGMWYVSLLQRVTIHVLLISLRGRGVLCPRILMERRYPGPRAYASDPPLTRIGTSRKLLDWFVP